MAGIFCGRCWILLWSATNRLFFIKSERKLLQIHLQRCLDKLSFMWLFTVFSTTCCPDLQCSDLVWNFVLHWSLAFAYSYLFLVMWRLLEQSMWNDASISGVHHWNKNVSRNCPVRLLTQEQASIWAPLLLYVSPSLSPYRTRKKKYCRPLHISA